MPSKGEINRSGELLRKARSLDFPISAQEKLDATAIVEEYRKGFGYPLTKVSSGLRGMVQQVAPEVLVSQRLKRMTQIIHKLERFPGTNLARMEDIGGCRAVAETSREIELLLERIERNWEIVRMRNYVETPKVSGYRAIHLVTERDGHRIEVQLRTKGQQAWANVVEKIGARYQVPLKDEIGPEELTHWLRLASENIAYKDQGEEPPASFGVEFSAALNIALDWMEAEDTK
ncbi:MAG: RelA/SpoT domain-containing protein [Candidatus Nanopelagicaceae bacterium]|nr:RelA/SpoT domain-containing protein [Candidatus Nanopelagicaceae bacterium]